MPKARPLTKDKFTFFLAGRWDYRKSIKEIKDVYPINDLFKSSIKNYKVLASIYKIFENHSDKNSKFDVKEIVSSRTSIVENLCGSKKVVKETEDEMINVYKQQNEEVRLLSYKILVESLNEKYKDLDTNQKNLLKEYINSISNTNSLKKLIDSEVTTVKKQLAELTNNISDDVIKIKIKYPSHDLEMLNLLLSSKAIGLELMIAFPIFLSISLGNLSKLGSPSLDNLSGLHSINPS